MKIKHLGLTALSIINKYNVLQAQQYIQVADGDNPFYTINVGSESAPSFFDYEGDGDVDLLLGNSNGTFLLYLNDDGVFSQASPNPFDGLGVDYNSVPTFNDFDNDGDFDLVSGGPFDGFYVFTNNSGSFISDTDAGLTKLYPGYETAPAFVDLDKDGDLDLVTGITYGNFYTFTNSDGIFTKANPNLIPSLDVGNRSMPTFIDIDDDDDLDLVTGNSSGKLLTYINTDNVFSAATTNPFEGVDVGWNSAPTAVDFDGDGNMELVVGTGGGPIKLFKRVTPLPVKLISFEAQNQGTDVHINWVTASEFNNEGFEIERSDDGVNWQRVGFILGHGSSKEEQKYQFVDLEVHPGQLYYRLKQIDDAGQFEYSKTVVTTVADQSIALFPNPVHNELHISGQVDLIRIYDVVGRLIYTQTNNDVIRVSSWTTGSYIAELQSGNEIERRLFMVN